MGKRGGGPSWRGYDEEEPRTVDESETGGRAPKAGVHSAGATPQKAGKRQALQQ